MALTLELDQHLFHGIISRMDMYCHQRNPQKEAKILKKILDTGFIASRKYLKEILTKEEYEILDKFTSVAWNGMDNVSITSSLKSTLIYGKTILEMYSDFTENDAVFPYNYYIKMYPSIILDPRLLKELTVRSEPYNKQPGEIQIEDKIPADYFVGIMLPNVFSNSALEKIATTYGPIDNQLATIKNDLLKLNEEEFLYKYYKDVILFENVLKETNSNLSLYHTETGLEILSSSDEFEILKKMKRICYKKQ